MTAVVPASAQRVRETTAVRSEDDRPLPVLPALEPLFAAGGLRRGSAVAVRGSASLLLALLAGPSRQGAWCAVVGLPALGLAAAAEAGIALERLALVPDPGRDWASVAAALLDAVDVVVVAPRGRVLDGDVRRLAARGRQRGAVLVPYGAVAWPGAELRLSVTAGGWEGLGDGSGHLHSRRAVVRGEGRGAAARARELRLWLPAADGEVRADTEPAGTPLRAVPAPAAPSPAAPPPSPAAPPPAAVPTAAALSPAAGHRRTAAPPPPDVSAVSAPSLPLRAVPNPELPALIRRPRLHVVPGMAGRAGGPTRMPARPAPRPRPAGHPVPAGRPAAVGGGPPVIPPPTAAHGPPACSGPTGRRPGIPAEVLARLRPASTLPRPPRPPRPVPIPVLGDAGSGDAGSGDARSGDRRAAGGG